MLNYWRLTIYQRAEDSDRRVVYALLEIWFSGQNGPYKPSEQLLSEASIPVPFKS